MPRRRKNEKVEDETKTKRRRVQRIDSESPVREQEEDQENQSTSSVAADEESLLNMEIPDRPAAAMSTDPNAPRLMITKIVVENFKSYYGKQVLGPFHKNFTSILGPNGSGKSNVIDALLFVFGFRANKIRSKKISVLIHNSADHPNVKSCSAVVHFAKIIDKGPSHEIQPGTEFTISRTANKSGGSVYYINGRVSSTGDVRDKLKFNGIDLDHNRFLILQGEVEQISLMKPKRNERTDEDGMLEYLEDIIGSSRLKKPIEKFKDKLEYFINEEEQMQKKLKLAETEVSVLVGPVQETIRLMRVENAITKCKYKIYCIDRLDAQQKVETMKNQVDELKRMHAAAEDQLSTCNDDIKTIQRKKANLTKEESNLKEKIDDVEKRRQEAVLEQRKSSEEIGRIENRKTKKEVEIKNERRKLEEAESAPSKANEAIKEYQSKIEKLGAEIEENENKLKELRVEEREANQSNRLELENIMPQITALNTEENNWDRSLSLTNDRLEGILKLASDPQNQLCVAEEHSKKLETELVASRAKLDHLKEQLPALSEQLKNDEKAAVSQRKRESELVEQIGQMQREIEAKRSDASANSSNTAVLNSLMDEKKSKRIPGILGRLGDLGGIDQRYDVAISTCCPQLDNIVVDTVETAQQCISFLRDNNMSRATFLALDKQQHLRAKIENKPKTPEDAPRLIDLITVIDETIKPAFYSVLKDTLFAETIEDASRISIQGDQRWRVVTARGEIIEASGTMTGGGRKEMRGRMGKKARIDTSNSTNDQDWRRMEQEVKVLREQLTKLRNELSRAIDQIKSQKEKYSSMEREHRILSGNIPKICQQHEHSLREIEKAKSAVQTLQVDERQIEELKAEIKRLEKEKEDVCKKASKLREQKDNLDSLLKKTEDKILGKTRDKLKELKSNLKQAEANCKNEQLTLKNSATTIERIHRNIKKAEEAIQEAQDDLVRINVNVSKLTQKVEAHIRQKEEYEKRLEEVNSEIQESTVAHEKLNKEGERLRKEIEEHSAELLAAERKMTAQLEALSDIEASIGKLALFTLRAGVTLPNSTTIAREVQETQQSTMEPNTESQDEPSIMETSTNVEVTTINEADAREIDEQTDDLPNATQFSIPEGETTLNSTIYDMGVLPTLTSEEIHELNRNLISEHLAKNEARKEKFKIKVNLSLIDEYAEKMERRDDVISEMDALREVHNKHRKKWHELTQQRNDEFNDGFQKICLATQEIYQMITLGGDAMLEKVNAMDTFTEGITFQVRPPKKTWKQITNLSGGEKTLASLALVFGLHTYRPTPLYVMDEIDAALDYRNVSIISTYLKERTKNAQFIIVSLRNNMFENGDRLLGIYKINDCTQNIVYDTQCFNDDSYDEDESET